MKFVLMLAVSWAVSACAHYPKECYPGLKKPEWKVTVTKQRRDHNGG